MGKYGLPQTLHSTYPTNHQPQASLYPTHIIDTSECPDSINLSFSAAKVWYSQNTPRLGIAWVAVSVSRYSSRIDASTRVSLATQKEVGTSSWRLPGSNIRRWSRSQQHASSMPTSWVRCATIMDGPLCGLQGCYSPTKTSNICDLHATYQQHVSKNISYF